jgi:dipeptidyl aminopeptidase/acylaminoacyl peptidase
MPRRRVITIDDLWRIERLGSPSLAPDGRACVCPVTRYAMEDNQGRSGLWLLSTDGGAPRALTRCGEKDTQPLWSPRGDHIAFIAKREQQGEKDDEGQLYLIAPDGGEARRAAMVATGVEAFKWCPDGRHIVFASWVWPELKGTAAQARQMKAWKERKETGVVTSEALYRYWDHFTPQDRVPHLHLLDTRTGKWRDLFEGTRWELTRAEQDASAFDISPDGRRIAFAVDPADEKRLDNPMAIAELDLRSGAVKLIVQHADWSCTAPRYSPDGRRLAFLAKHQGRKHTMPDQLALWHADGGRWEVASADWDREPHAPLRWRSDGAALLFTAEERGRCHVWQFDLEARHAEIVARGGNVQGFDLQGDVLVTVADAMDHPAQVWAHGRGESRRIERFNDALLAELDFARHDEVTLRGARGDEVQMWVVYPPGFDPNKRWPVMQAIHGGPHAASLDTFHYRWNNQLFAAQGYVVACVNYHGSSGFGYDFLDSITHHWGDYELQDVEAGTDWLLAQPWADRQRVYATGGSYGGFMAAWMNAHVPAGRYAAYVCHAGCFDWTAMFADDAYTWHAKELGAWYWDDLAKVQSQSPHASAAAMATPTLVIHGALDYRVPDAQGLAYYNTLKARGVPARLLWFPDENHWVLKPRNSRLWYREFFDWLQRFGSASSGHRSKKNSRPPHAEEQRSVQPLEGRKTAAPRRPARSSPRSR